MDKPKVRKKGLLVSEAVLAGKFELPNLAFEASKNCYFPNFLLSQPDIILDWHSEHLLNR
jgi:hypothetical protein